MACPSTPVRVRGLLKPIGVRAAGFSVLDGDDNVPVFVAVNVRHGDTVGPAFHKVSNG
jgi:hypothetical protein